jgi:hypothetical protein
LKHLHFRNIKKINFSKQTMQTFGKFFEIKKLSVQWLNAKGMQDSEE